MSRKGSTKRNSEQILTAIRGSGGVVSTIAQRLDVTRSTVYRYLKKPRYREAYDDEVSLVLDLAESVVMGNIRASAHRQRASGYTEVIDSGDAKWYLSRKGADRGYGERSELDINAGRIVVEWVDDWRSVREPDD